MFEKFKTLLRRLFVHDDTVTKTQHLYLRALGLIYSVAFLILVRQSPGLFFQDGLTPISKFLSQHTDPPISLFLWLGSSDATIMSLAMLGLGFSLLLVAGFANSWTMALLWGLYMSFAHSGQIFYGFGWDILMLEMGFLGIFMVPLFSMKIRQAASPLIIMWLHRWLLFRLMFGAGMIKIRGDSCWLDLTCMFYHYETQPNPNFFSLYFHHLPEWVHVIEVAFNHLVELIMPFLIFLTRPFRWTAGIFTAIFQVLLILSGNLAFLNWQALIITICCFDDRIWPQRLMPTTAAKSPFWRPAITIGLTAVILWLSQYPVKNLFSGRQLMNASFDPLHIVNTYGAFGSITRKRTEIVISAQDSLGKWHEYEFYCKPGDIYATPCWISPYHIRLDWQMWFSAMRPQLQERWLLQLAIELLKENPRVEALLHRVPDIGSPLNIKMDRYHYKMAEPFGKGWWTREKIGIYLPPINLSSPGLQPYLDN